MGFEYINEDQKIRISLSERAYNIMRDDMRVFDVKTPATFVNKLIENFKDSSIVSITSYLKYWKNSMIDKLKVVPIDSKSKDTLLQSLSIQEEERIKNIINEYKKEKKYSSLYRINNENTEYLMEECEDDYFYSRPGLYIKCLIEDYSCLPFIERERIYRKEVYDIVEFACENNRLMKVNIIINNKRETLYIYPYKIMSDSMNSQSYLACYTHKPNEDSSSKKDASFAMSRLPVPTLLKASAFLSKADKESLETHIRTKAINFLLGEETEIRVRLNSNGKRTFHNRIVSRPILDDVLSTEEEYVFHCTESQAFFYFYSFGANAEIVSPLSLRERMIKSHTDALKIYEEN